MVIAVIIIMLSSVLESVLEDADELDDSDGVQAELDHVSASLSLPLSLVAANPCLEAS